MNNQKGFTLVEIMFVVAILPILGMALFGVLAGSNQVYRNTDMYAVENEAGMQILRTISRELSQTSYLSSPSHLNISNTGPSASTVLRFQIPVDWDNDGDAVTSAANPAAEWGAYDNVGDTTNGRLGSWVRYQLVASGVAATGNQLTRDVLTSGLAQIQGTSKILASNVTAFSVTQSTNTLTLTLTVQKTEPVSGRVFSATFSHRVLLRNNVS